MYVIVTYVYMCVCFCMYVCMYVRTYAYIRMYRGADKSLALPGRKQAAATEDFDFDIPYL